MGTNLGDIANLEQQHKQVVFLSTELLEQVEQYKVASGATSLSQACYELIKLGLAKAREIADTPDLIEADIAWDFAQGRSVASNVKAYREIDDYSWIIEPKSAAPPKTPLEESWCCSDCKCLDLMGNLPVCNSLARYNNAPIPSLLPDARCSVCPKLTATECDYKVEGVNKVYG